MARSAAKPQKPAAEPPLGRKDWIEAAITMLAEDNVEALRVDTLAEKLGVTKGSFYWHFKGREDLLSAVLDEWRLRMTSEVQSLIFDRSGTPWERLERLLRIAISGRPDVPGGPFEITLRDWARRDQKVASVVRAVDEDRIAFAAQLYREAGLSEADSQDYAEAHMAVVIGIRMTLVDSSNRDEIKRRRRIGAALLLPRERVGEKP
jgi:AcrR family transcriptional regulator